MTWLTFEDILKILHELWPFVILGILTLSAKYLKNFGARALKLDEYTGVISRQPD